MSVVQSKRGQGELEVLTKARELATYTIKICTNEKSFPKRYGWCITNKIVENAIFELAEIISESEAVNNG